MRCLDASYAPARSGWPLRLPEADIVVPATGHAQACDGEALRQLAQAGLEDCNPGDSEEVHAAYVGQGGQLPLRVRALLDFLARHVGLG